MYFLLSAPGFWQEGHLRNIRVPIHRLAAQVPMIYVTLTLPLSFSPLYLSLPTFSFLYVHTPNPLVVSELWEIKNLCYSATFWKKVPNCQPVESKSYLNKKGVLYFRCSSKGTFHQILLQKNHGITVSQNFYRNWTQDTILWSKR